MKKPILRLWIVSTLLAISIAAKAYDFVRDGIYYNVTSSENKTVEVTYPTTTNAAIYYKDNVVISPTVQYQAQTFTVTSIGSNAFYNCTSLKNVTIPESVTNIEWMAFAGCTALTSITIPEAVSSIGSSAFKGCSALTNLSFLAEDCTFCGNSSNPAFPSSIDTLILGDKVRQIPSYFLYNGNQVATINLPDSLKSIGDYAFYNSSALTSLIIPENLMSIGKSAFAGSSVLTTLIFNAINCETCGTSGSPAFPGSIKSLTVGDKVTIIPSYFLYNGSSFEDLNIPESVTSIGTYAFRSNTKLKSVVIPPNVNYIGSNAFSNCSSLVKNAYPSNLSNPFSNGTSIAYTKECTIENGVIYDNDKNTVYFAPLSLPQSFVMPNSVTSIGANAFLNCTGLTEITIPEAVTSIGNSAFKGCTSLTYLAFNAENCTSCGSQSAPAFPATISTLNIGEKVTKIPAYFLFNGSQLKSLTIPNSVTSIGANAFLNCTGLTEITIPEAVTSIGNSAFKGCTSLTCLAFNAENCTSCGSQSAPAFPATISKLNIGENVTNIPAFFLSEGSQLISLTIPNAVTTIGQSAFFGSTNLVSLTMGSGLLSIDSYAFSYRPGSNVTNITIPKVFWLGNSLPTGINNVSAKINYVSNGRSSCSNQKIYQFLSSKFEVDGTIYVPVSPSDRTCDVVDCNYDLQNGEIVISDKVVNRGVELTVLQVNDYSYYNNPTILSLTIANNGNIGTYAFCECGALTAVTAANEGYIGNGAFYNCDALTSVLVRNNGYIGSYAFYECNSLATVTATNNGYIGNMAFGHCGSLLTLNAANNGYIGSYAFYHCSNMTTASLNNIGSIENEAFLNCSALEKVTFGNFITTIGNKAFYSCASLPDISIPDNVTAIGEYIFSGCSKLAKVNLGKGLTTIPKYTFQNCSLLDSLTIPNNIKTIEDYAFSGCGSLSNLTIEGYLQEKEELITPQTFEDWTSTNHLDGSTSYKEYSIEVKAGDILYFDYAIDSESGYDFLIIKINGTQVVKESGKKTGNYTKTFSEVGSITLYLSYTKDSSTSSGQDQANVSNITLNGKSMTTDYLNLGSNSSKPLFADCPLGVVYIGRKLSYDKSSDNGYSPFHRNTSLHSVEITDAETQIYDYEFWGCTNLKTLKIGNGVKTIGNWAFSGCSSLDFFSAGYNVETIGDEAFSDCIGLTSFYSFSTLPPTCGKQALDDINKWECTLFVPAESSDEYKAADQWKEFFFVNENDAVLIEKININVESLNGKTGDTFQLVAEILPENATRKEIEWSSSDTSVATIDSDGLVTFVREGVATITAKAIDGSEVEASIPVVVTVKEPELGDSNANGVVNVADAVNTANYAIGNEVEFFDEKAADVNQDGIISMADASATITLILEQPVTTASMSKVRSLSATPFEESDKIIIDNFSLNLGERASISVRLENSIDYVALQADVTVPDGMVLEEVKIGKRVESTHSLAVKRIDDRTMRVALFNLNSAAFADDSEAILELIVKKNSETTDCIKSNNVMASDAKAHEFVLTAVGGHNADMSGIGSIDTKGVRIESRGNNIEIYNAEGCEITIHAIDGTELTHFIAYSDSESYEVVQGLYIVSVGNKVQKVMVK